MKLDVAYLSVLIGVFIPLLTGFLTKEFAHSGLKAVVNLTLSAVTGVLVVMQQGGGVISKQALVAAACTWVASIATHYGLWDPTNIADDLQALTSKFGLGKEQFLPGSRIRLQVWPEGQKFRYDPDGTGIGFRPLTEADQADHAAAVAEADAIPAMEQP